MFGIETLKAIKSKNKVPLLGEFLIIASIAIIIFATISGWFGWQDFQSRLDFVKLQLETEAERLEHGLTDTLEHSEYLLTHINSQIQNRYHDLPYIKNILQTYSYTNRQNREVFSLSMFSWTDEKGRIIVNSEHGVLKNPVDISDREVMKNLKFRPNKLQFNQPTKGAISDQWILPIAMGMIDENGKYLGATVAGFNLDGFRNRLETSVKNEAISFVLLDENYDPIVSTLGPDFPLNIFQEKLKNSPPDALQRGFLNHTNLLEHDALTYYSHPKKYPFTFLVAYDKKESDKEIYESLLAYNLEVLIMGLVLIMFFVILRKRIVNPVIELSHAAEAIAKGSQTVEIPHHESYEMEILGIKLSEILRVKQELHKAQEEIKKANQILDIKVKERTFELEKALQSKSEFLNNMSHEIRTPIHGVQGYSEVLVEDWSSLEEDERYNLVKKLHKASERLLALINNLLDLSRFSSGKMQFSMKKTNLKKLTESIMDEVESLYLNKKPLTVSLEVTKDSLVEGTMDADRIKQVIRNLFANAIKFTASGNIKATISNDTFRRSDHQDIQGIKFSIKDEGIGIPDGELSEIFHAFTQSSRTKTLAGGTGLGLSICYEIIDAHHGIIWAENNKDKGACFNFIIPMNSQN